MFPFSFEWVWDMAHMLFMGSLWYALSIIGIGLAYVIIKTIADTSGTEGGHTDHH